MNVDAAEAADMRACRILLADDSYAQRALMEAWLTQAGYVQIGHAVDGPDAIRQYYEFKPDLLLLDVAMPGLDGIEVCRRLSARHPGAVPILIQSGLLHPDDRVRAFDAGAVDFVGKPLHPAELVARVRTHLEIRWMVQKLHRFRARLSDELMAARRLQESLLPSAQDIEQLRQGMGLEIAAHCEMSSELGGDIWGFRRIDDHRLGLYIADFTGHGVASAMNAFRLHAVLGEAGIRFERPDLVMQALNVRLASVLPPGSFATLFYGVIDMKLHRLAYTAAGAPAPVLIDPDGSLHEIDASGVPAGIRHWHAYDVRTLDFPPGATLFLYSDALTESPDVDGRIWDEDELPRVLAASGQRSATDCMARVLRAFDTGRARPLPDDLTLVFLRRVIGIEGIS
jgi:sigma-B regulation protein RsbU (phosphoserine phosphatase)